MTIRDPRDTPISDVALLTLGDGTYSQIKHFANGERGWLARFAFTVAICSGTTNWRGYDRRWCYHTMADARRALDEWDGTGEPEGWHREPDTGRRYEDDGQGNKVLVIRP